MTKPKKISRRANSKWTAAIVTLISATVFLIVFRNMSTTPTPPRHLVLVTVDTLRADRLGAYGYPQASTPNFDALAKDSIRFERTFSHASMTVPSVATLVTGRLPAAHTLLTNTGQLPEELPTLATRLHNAGFASAGFIGNYALRPSRGFFRGFDLYTEEYLTTEKIRPHPENLAGPLTDDAIEWISDRNPDRRLFLWVHYQEPHGAYTPPTFSAPKAGDDDIVLPKNSTNSGKGGIPKYQWLGHGRLSEYEARYDGEIAEFDRHLGRLVKALESSGVLQESILILAADHGEAFGEDDIYCAHGEGLSEALLRVPLLLKIPGYRAGVRRDTVRLIDVARTALEVLNIDATGFEGMGLLDDVGHRPVFAQVTNRKQSWRSYRNGGYEIRQALGLPAVLHVDPGVSRDGLEALALSMEHDLRQAAPWPQDEDLNSEALSDEETKALRALGYVE